MWPIKNRSSQHGGWMKPTRIKTIEVLVEQCRYPRRCASWCGWRMNNGTNVIDTSLHGFLLCYPHYWPNSMLMKKYGRIINVSLSGVEKACPEQTNYSTSKSSQDDQLPRTWPEISRKGITVNAVAPGFIKTDLDGSWMKNWKPWSHWSPFRNAGGSGSHW